MYVNCKGFSVNLLLRKVKFNNSAGICFRDSYIRIS